MRISLVAVTLVLLTRPAAALLCGTVLDPIRVSATTLAFGNYLPTSAAVANTTVTVSCTIPVDLLTAFTVSLSAGNAANPGVRYLKQGTNQLPYNIYTDPGYSTVWGDGSGGSISQSYGGVLSIGSINFTGYGRVPQGQYVLNGPYADRITVTVSY